MSYLNEIKKHLELVQRRDASLGVAIRTLDALLLEHRERLDVQLVHYLTQRSYDKALRYVDAATADTGASGAAGGASPATGLHSNSDANTGADSAQAQPPCQGRTRR